MPRLTISAINIALHVRGHKERLARGKGYFYFYDGEAAEWPQSGVYVFRLNELTLEGWLEKRNELAAAKR